MDVIERVDRSPFVAFILAIYFAVLSYILLGQGELLIGAVSAWASGFHTRRWISKQKT